MSRAVLMLVTLLAWTPLAAAQEPGNAGPAAQEPGNGGPAAQEPGAGGPAAQEPAPPGCRRCQYRGVVDCKLHDEELRALEPTVLCSEAAACPQCAGALVVDCERCDGGPESAAMLARRAELAAWAAQQHEVEVFLGRRLQRIDTLHLELVASIDTLWLPGRKTKPVDGHHFLHCVARDGERAAALIAGHYGAQREDYRAAMRLWYWQEMADHKRIMADFLGSASTGDFKTLGRTPLFSVCTADQVFKDDAVSLHTLAVHNIAHMLLSNLTREEWIGDLGAGWFDAGAAHWYEEAIFGRHRHYCVTEAPYPFNWNDGLWRAELRKLLDKEQASILPALVRKQTGELMDHEHAKAWSFYDWLVANHPQALAPMLLGLKDRQPARELFAEHLGMSVPDAETAWRSWVVSTYPKKEK